MTLYLLPNLLHETQSHKRELSEAAGEAVLKIQGLIAESEKGGRLFLKRFFPDTFRTIPLQLLNEHTEDPQIERLLDPLARGEIWGLISDCGLPCFADPGASLVLKAREKGILVEAFPGPSSIVQALLLSGLPAQEFVFHGYLPREPQALHHRIKSMEKEKKTHLFIEAPYRNQKMLSSLLSSLSPNTYLSIAWDLFLPSQGVYTHLVSTWKSHPAPSIEKKPAIFLIRTF
jgi:16S rRNA (cytidine1402-2'-O)-methyltransferase